MSAVTSAELRPCTMILPPPSRASKPNGATSHIATEWHQALSIKPA
jgi:hypothetical protein